MPITFCGPGDLLKSKAQVIVIPVNTVGVMGSGFALWYKKTFPAGFEQYRQACRNKELRIGTLRLQRLTKTRYALLFPTKASWTQPSELSYIEAGLKRFCELYESKGVTSIAFPAIGCGLGGIEFSLVKELLYQYLDPLPINVEVYSWRQVSQGGSVGE